MRTIYLIIFGLIIWSCTSNKKITEQIEEIHSSPDQINTPLEIAFVKGKSFNHPSFAIWVEDLEGNYIETLFVTQYVATGKFGHGESEPGKWKNESDYVRRPASLPYWAHKRNIQAPDGLYIPSPETAVPDALTGATPQTGFILSTGTKVKSGEKFSVLMEINQAWDSNNFWTNNKYPDDKDYFTSLQPALVYSVTIEAGSEQKEFVMNPIGHSHPSGKNGELFKDLSTITTAKEIAANIVVQLK